MRMLFKFFEPILPIFPKEKIIIKPRENKLVRIDAPFTNEVSSLAIVKLLDKLNSKCYNVKGKIFKKYCYARYN